MPKLKVFVTQSGFFEVAVAAPSMKAAIEALGIPASHFKHGFAKQTQDAKIMAAVMAKPGVVLRRPVGTKAAFTEHPSLPMVADVDNVPNKKAATEGARGSRAGYSHTAAKRKTEDVAKKRAEKHQAALRDKAFVALAAAKKRHIAILESLDEEQSRIEERRKKEEDRWLTEKTRLKARL